MSARLPQILADQLAIARWSRDEFAAELTRAGVVLPSLGLDDPGDGYPGVILVDLGRARPDVLDVLTILLREALDAREHVAAHHTDSRAAGAAPCLSARGTGPTPRTTWCGLPRANPPGCRILWRLS